jgi:hypothetical protein
MRVFCCINFLQNISKLRRDFDALWSKRMIMVAVAGLKAGLAPGSA